MIYTCVCMSIYIYHDTNHIPRTQLLKNIATQETLKLLMLIVCSTYRLVLHIACWTIHGCSPQQTSSDIGFPSQPLFEYQRWTMAF